MARSVRQRNQAIARSYDDVPYETSSFELLSAERIQGIAGLYGCGPALGDILDIGCGRGVDLERLARLTTGRAVGVDLSKSATERASERCNSLGDRVRILTSDFMDLEANALGAFDLILNIGTLFVVPAEVRAHLLDLIAECLAPGGVAVISYYVGPAALLKAGVQRMLRCAIPPGASRIEATEIARGRLRALAEGMPQAVVGRELLQAALTYTADRSDTLFLHEVLSPEFSVLQTSELEAALSMRGVGFLTYLGGGMSGRRTTSRERALEADVLDFYAGGYRHAVFGRYADGAGAPDARASGVAWTTDLRRQTPAGYGGSLLFASQRLRASIEAPGIQAFLDELALGPQSYDGAMAGALRRLTTAGMELEAARDAMAVVDPLSLWGHAITWPIGANR